MPYKTRKTSLGFRSGFEEKTAAYLKSKGVKFEYESLACKFKYFKKVTSGCVVIEQEDGSFLKDTTFKGTVAQSKTYTCDFIIEYGNGKQMFIETKGYFKAPDRKKHTLLKKQFKDIDIRMLFSGNGWVSKTTGTRYSGWCEREGIPYYCLSSKEMKAGVFFPEHWLEELR